jgi:hypothetical protein
MGAREHQSVIERDSLVAIGQARLMIRAVIMEAGMVESRTPMAHGLIGFS